MDRSPLADLATWQNLGNAALLMIVAFIAAAIIAFRCASPRLDWHDVTGAFVAAVALATLPLVIGLDGAFYLNPEDIYIDRETGLPHLGEIFMLCYPWILPILFPASILILTVLIQDRRRKEKQLANSGL